MTTQTEYFKGGAIRLRAEFFDPDGGVPQVAEPVTFTVKGPDGVLAPIEGAENEELSTSKRIVYEADFVPSEAGHYAYRAESAGPLPGAAENELSVHDTTVGA